MAIACFLLFTTPPLPPFPDRNVPCFRRRIALLTVLPAAFPYLAIAASWLCGLDGTSTGGGPTDEVKWVLALPSCALPLTCGSLVWDALMKTEPWGSLNVICNRGSRITVSVPSMGRRPGR